MTDVFSKRKRSEVMSKIRSRDTKPELKFRNEHPEAIDHPRLPFSPDFLLDGKAVFLDSSFWHGYVSTRRWERLPGYWRGKLFRNVVRDLCANAFYGELGILRRIIV